MRHELIESNLGPPTVGVTASSPGTTMASTTRPRQLCGVPTTTLTDSITSLAITGTTCRQTEREIILEEFLEARKRATTAARHRTGVNTGDTHHRAALRMRRDSMKPAADIATEIDLPDWYGRIEETSKRHAARRRQRASRKKENRSNSGGDRFNFEGDRSNSRGDAEKNAHARDISVVFTTKS